MSTPTHLKYTKDHEWIRIDGNQATVGITEFAQRELGDIVYVEINSLGKALKANEVFGTVEAVKTVSDLYLPLAGTILELNPRLDKNPELVNQDPYGEGWMIRMTLSDPGDGSGLLDQAAYDQLTGA